MRISGFVPDFNLINRILKGEEFHLDALPQDFSNRLTRIITAFNILVKYGFVNIVHSLSAKTFNGIPPLTNYILMYQNIISRITNKQDMETLQQNNIVTLLVNPSVEIMTYPVQIPKYNLLHFGMICHFNSCLNILSSLTGLINKLTLLHEAQQLNPTADLIYRHLMNTLSYVDLNPNLSNQILSVLKINPNAPGESRETMKKLMEPLYQSGLPLNNTFFWDSSDTFYKTNEINHTVSQKLSELKPKYFICSVHDFNSVYDIDDQQIDNEEFQIVDDEEGKTELSYRLSSFIIFNGGHYTSAFIVDNSNPKSIIIKNDILPRYTIETKQYNEAYNKQLQHTIACYVRLD